MAEQTALGISQNIANAANNNEQNIILEILDRLEDVINDSKENEILVKRIKNIIEILNEFNKKYEELKGLIQNLINDNNNMKQKLNKLDKLDQLNKLDKLNNVDQIYNMIKSINDKINPITKDYTDGSNKKGKYVGTILNGQRNGNGTINYENGESYTGEWKNDQMNGIGTYTYSNKNRYEGNWENNMRKGYGVFYFYNGDRYEGHFDNNFAEGKGVFYFKDKDIYEGDFKGGKRSGKGVYYYANHKDYDSYYGDWKYDKKNGEGITFYKDGSIRIGKYENDSKTGEHKKIKDKKVIIEEYVNGELKK